MADRSRLPFCAVQVLCLFSSTVSLALQLASLYGANGGWRHTVGVKSAALLAF